jgi:addiction module HigA family antidote
MSAKRRMPPVHPGEILREDFMKPRGLSSYALAHAINVPQTRINDIVLERRGITADTARRLAAYFGTTVRVWTGLQARFEVEVERDRLSDDELLEEVQSLSTN